MKVGPSEENAADGQAGAESEGNTDDLNEIVSKAGCFMAAVAAGADPADLDRFCPTNGCFVEYDSDSGKYVCDHGCLNNKVN